MHPYTPTVVAEALLTTLDAAAAERGRAVLAIPGGRSPGPILTEMGRQCDAFLRQRLHLVWLDERAVPRGHADRNDAPTLAAWQAGGELPAHVHPMPAELDDLDAAARAYATVLEAVCHDQPIDAALVGIGEDGHCASLFPNHAGLQEFDSVFAVTDSPKPPPRRLTVSLPVLRVCPFKVIVALGAAKGAVAKQALAKPDDPSLPCSMLGPGTTWFVDEAAAEAMS